MIVANEAPNFISVYKSMDDIEKRKLLITPYVIETGFSEQTWFRKVNKNTWTMLERKWLADKLGISIEILFPNN